MSIFTADFVCASGYVVLGFLFIKLSLLSFWQATFLYIFLWFLYIEKYRPIVEVGERSQIRPLLKGPIVLVLSSILLFLKSVLGGIVVTFPFSGVFAVVEARKTLYTLAGEFTKNSLAILIFFVITKVFSDKLGFYYSIGLGWLFYLPFLLFLQRIKN